MIRDDHPGFLFAMAARFGYVQTEAMSGAYSFLKVLTLALLQEYKTSMCNGYPYRAPDYSFNFTHLEKEA